MSASNPNESPANESPRGGAGIMIVILLAGLLLCGGSIGGIAFVTWRLAQTAAEREEQAAIDAEAANRQQVEAEARERFERVAIAVAAGLKGPNRLADSYSADGKPLLSWRVHVLPLLGEHELYRRFKLDEPWDSPANSKLLKSIPGIFVPPRPQVGNWQPGWTYIRGYSHEGAVFEPRARFGLNDLAPGPDQTLAIFDSGEPIEWTRPDRFDWRDPNAKPSAGGLLPGSKKFLAATASGRVVWIDKAIPADVLRQISLRRHEPSWDLRAREWMD